MTHRNRLEVMKSPAVVHKHIPHFEGRKIGWNEGMQQPGVHRDRWLSKHQTVKELISLML